MLRKCLLVLSVLCLAAAHGAAIGQVQEEGSKTAIKQDAARQPERGTGGQSFGDQDRGGFRGFYAYPRHRHVDGGSGSGLDRRPFSSLSAGTSPYCDNCHGSAYYGRDYGAPYFGGGYYDRGVYYRERRDR